MKHLRIVIAISAMALVIGACTTAGATPGEGVATLSEENSPTTDTTTQDTMSSEEAIDAYNKCVTDEGMPELAISENDGGGGTVDLDSSSPEGDSSGQADIDFDRFEEVTQKCDTYLDSAFGQFDLSPEQDAALKDAELAFNKCMKEQGFDLPEFDDSSENALDSEPGSGSLQPLEIAEEDFEKFTAASDSCAKVFDAINGQLDTEEAGG